MLGASKDIINKAIKAGADEAEVYITATRSTNIEVMGQKIEGTEIKKESGVGVRIFKNKKLGFGYAAGTSTELIDEAIIKAIEASRFSEADDLNTLPHPRNQTVEMDLFDKEISTVPIERKIEFAIEIERAAYSFDNRIKKTEKAVYHDGATETWIANSRGIKANFIQNYCGGHIEVIAEDGFVAENGQHSKFVNSLKSFDPRQVGLIAAKKAVELLNAGSAPSSKLDLVMEPIVAAHFLEAMSPLFSADNIQKGKSLLRGKLQAAIGSNILTIIDNGTLPDGLGSSPFDSEGVPTGQTILVSNGAFKSPLYDNYTAKKDNTASTGNGGRSGFKGLPAVSPTNLYIEAGDVSGDDIIKGVSRGLYVTRVMGMHTINPISGDFSVGAAGLLIENGKLTRPVRALTIAGNLIDVLMSVKGVGSDLEFQMNIGAPTLLIEGISVSGA